VNEVAHQEQLPAVQELFAEGFVQLQQELSEAQARSTTQQGNDPLAILHHIHKKATKKKAKAVISSKHSEEGAGFLQEIATPEHVVRTQQVHAKKHAALIRRMEKAAAEGKRNLDISARRPSSRKSIWNQVLETSRKDAKNASSSASVVTTAASIEEAANRHATAVCHACGSDRVRTLASHTARDVRKNEIWGGGGSNETLSRVQCLDCGKTWNEED
jgi:hypothetical protein